MFNYGVLGQIGLVLEIATGVISWNSGYASHAGAMYIQTNYKQWRQITKTHFHSICQLTVCLANINSCNVALICVTQEPISTN